MDKKRIPVWPVFLLALPAAVSIWSGWVGLGGLIGFGEVNLLPGLVDNFKVNTAITLPIGMEAYGAYALRIWLANSSKYIVPVRAQIFAKWSSIGALILGALGQVTFHVLSAAGVTAADQVVTALVSCLPVGELGLGAVLVHLLRDDIASDDIPLVPHLTAEKSTPEVPILKLIPSEDEFVFADVAPNGSYGTTDQVRDIAPKSFGSLLDTVNPREFILDSWNQGRRITSTDLYERFPQRKRDSLRSVLSTVRRDNPGLEPPDREIEE